MDGEEGLQLGMAEELYDGLHPLERTFHGEQFSQERSSRGVSSDQ